MKEYITNNPKNQVKSVKNAEISTKQNFDNLPDELSFQPRFFTVGRDVNGVFDVKAPVVKWNNPRNQRHYSRLVYTDPRQMAGFDIVGHGKAADYLVLDFDHVLTDEGDFVNETAQKWFNLVALSGTYIEKSVSGHGLHAIFKPSSTEFKKMAAGIAATLYLSDSRANDAPKIEIFYKPNGRYFLLTGDVYDCAPKTPIATDCDVVSTILDEIKKQQPKLRSVQKKDTPIVGITDNQALALDALKFIPCAEIDYTDWLSVGMILKTNGNPIDDWIDWSRTDSARFDENTCNYKWTTFKTDEGELNIGSLIFMAKKFGYQPPAQLPSSDTPDGLTDAQTIEWIKSKLDWEKGKGGKMRVSRTQRNLDLIFDYDPNIKNLIGYDEFYKQEVFLKDPLWKKNCIGDEWKNADDSHLRGYLKQTYTDYRDTESVMDNIIIYSRKNSFHPVKQYLESLHWDGVPRAETYFSKFLNADDTPYTREITLKWLLGAIARIYHEGCDFQFALVLHGRQGVGKSFSLRMLGQKWHVSLTDSLDDTHALDTIERGWIVEIAELAAGRKSEINHTKAFLSDNADTRRKAYARRAETTPRHCVFGISVNDEHFLRDLTGNRRYKIIECHSAQNEIVEGLTAEYVNQVWAEAFHIYQELFKDKFDDQLLRLSREVDAMADEIAEKHLQDDGLQGEIAAFLDKPILPNFIWERLTKEERRTFTANGRIKLDPADINARITTQIKQATKRDSTLKEFSNYMLDSETDVNCYVLREYHENGKGYGEDTYYFYGSVDRESTCAAEVFNECFGNDKRKNTNRINEVLANLEGWKREDKRTKNFAGTYGDQKNSYWRETPRHDSTFAKRISALIDDEGEKI